MRIMDDTLLSERVNQDWFKDLDSLILILVSNTINMIDFSKHVFLKFLKINICEWKNKII